MAMTPDLHRALDLQARGCAALGSPFYAGLLRRIDEDLAAMGPSADLLAPWRSGDFQAVVADAVFLRLLGGLHDLVLSGDDPALAAVWPGPETTADAELAWPRVQAALAREPARLAAFMDHEPQTNEVGRSAALVGGFLAIAARTGGLPLRCFELGASAGLNQVWDRFAYDLGGVKLGPAGSPVRLRPDWTGDRPPSGPLPQVNHRAACDRRPAPIADPASRRRLLAYVWPDQGERLARLRAAIDLALAEGVEVEAADAGEWTRARVDLSDGAATVLYHSVFWQYVPAEGQRAIVQAAQALGDRASAAAPFAWLRMEPADDLAQDMELRLTTWPGGEDRRLGLAHPHGARVEWRG